MAANIPLSKYATLAGHIDRCKSGISTPMANRYLPGTQALSSSKSTTQLTPLTLPTNANCVSRLKSSQQSRSRQHTSQRRRRHEQLVLRSVSSRFRHSTAFHGPNAASSLLLIELVCLLVLSLGDESFTERTRRRVMYWSFNRLAISRGALGVLRRRGPQDQQPLIREAIKHQAYSTRRA